MKFGASAQLCLRYSSPDGHHHFQMAEAVPGPSRGMCAILPINLSACPVFEEPGTMSVNESAPECPEPSLPLDPCVAAAAAKLLQSCPTLCDPIDGSPQGSPVPGILQARTLEWVAISSSRA